MKIKVIPVNPGFQELFLKYVSELENPSYTLVGTEGWGNTTYIFECDEENHWLTVDGIKAAIRRPPLGNAMGCQVVPYGMITWPPIVDKDKYPKP